MIVDRNVVVLVFLVSVLFVFFPCLSLNAFQAEVSPSEIKPGDAFVVKVIGAKTSPLPTASLIGKQFNFSSCGEGCFISIGAVEIDTNPGVYTIKLRVGWTKRSLQLMVKHTIFPTLELTLPEDKVFLTPENLKRVRREGKRIKSICQIVSDRLWEGSFILPLGNDISTLFGVKRILNKERVSVHRGLDIKGQWGEKVKASNHGRVVLAEELFFGGNTIILDHGQGIYTIYMHLLKSNVTLGDTISKGDIIGFVGATGRATGPHLHFGVKVLNINTDPASFAELDL